jgi:hypothetical protein
VSYKLNSTLLCTKHKSRLEVLTAVTNMIMISGMLVQQQQQLRLGNALPHQQVVPFLLPLKLLPLVILLLYPLKMVSIMTNWAHQVWKHRRHWILRTMRDPMQPTWKGGELGQTVFSLYLSQFLCGFSLGPLPGNCHRYSSLANYPSTTWLDSLTQLL